MGMEFADYVDLKLRLSSAVLGSLYRNSSYNIYEFHPHTELMGVWYVPYPHPHKFLLSRERERERERERDPTYF